MREAKKMRIIATIFTNVNEVLTIVLLLNIKKTNKIISTLKNGIALLPSV